MKEAKKNHSTQTLHVGVLILAVVMLISILTVPDAPGQWVSAAEGNGATDGTKKRVADDSTVDTYESFLLNDESARYVGRVWTDKSVYAADSSSGKGSALVDGKTEEFTEDFLEVFSAMGSTLEVNGEMQLPLDVMFVLDMSTSMSEDVGGGATRLYNAIGELNKAFAKVMDNNPDNRAGLVVYSGDNGFSWDKNTRYLEDDNHTPVQSGYINAEDGVVALPLGHYDKPANNYFGYYKGQKYGFSFLSGYGYYQAYVEAWGSEYTQYPLVYLGVNIDGYGGTYYQALGATNTQLGLYKGMHELATAAEPATGTTDLSKRKPVVILITDGQPTMATSLENWWDPADHVAGKTYIGEGTNVHYGNGMLTMASAAYMRTQISAHYKTTGSNSLYLATIGIDMDKLKTDTEEPFAYTTLNPAGLNEDAPRVRAGGPGNGDDIYTAFQTYMGTAQKATIPTGANNNSGAPKPDGQYEFKHPPADFGWDLEKVEDLFYNDTFANTDSGAGLEAALDRVLSTVMQGTIDVPIEGAGDLVTNEENALSYSDPIGEYMDVKNVFKLRLFDVDYKVITNDGGKNYTVVTAEGNDATVVNPCYGNDKTKDFKLSDIKIWVNSEPDKNINGLTRYELRVDIPSTAVPVRMATVDRDKDNKIESYRTNIDEPGVAPLRLFYTVGMQEDYIVKNGSALYVAGSVDLTTIDETYKQQHRDPLTGQINFYANYFSGGQYIYSGGADYDRGDAMSTFSPHINNRYYIYQDFMPLYTEKNNPESYVTSPDGIKSDGIYYFGFKYYTKPGIEINGHISDGIETAEIERVGAMFGSGVPGKSGYAEYLVWYDLDTGIFEDFDENGPTGDGKNYVVATKVGGIRVGNMGDHSEEGFKDAGNNTQTSTTYYLPTVSENTTNDNAMLNSYLGNNGVLSVSDSEVMVTKEVIYDPNQVTEEMISELKAKEEFDYTIEVEGSDFTGELKAVMVTMDAPPHGWRALVNKIELQPNNQGLLVSNSGRLYVHEQDGQEYYVYIGGDNTTPVSVFDSDLNGGLRDDGTDVTPLSVTGVKLLPKEKYSSSWSASNGDNDLEDGPEPFPVGQVDETKEIGAEVGSPYKLKTTYQTKTVHFDDGKAEFTLNHLAGLLFTGLSGGMDYTVQEKLTKEQEEKGIGLNHIDYEQYNKLYDSASGTFSLAQIGDTTTLVNTADGIISEVTITSPEGVDHVHYFNDYIPASLEVPKIVSGIPGDDQFKFEITLTAPEGTKFTGYYAAYIHHENHRIPVDPDDPSGETRPCLPSDHESLEFDLNDKAEYRFTVRDDNYVPPTDPDVGVYPGEIVLSSGLSFVILGLPAGTKYEINEVIVSGDDEAPANYITTINVTNNEVAATFDNNNNDDRTVTGKLNSTVHRKIDGDEKSVGYIERVIVTYTNINPLTLPDTYGTPVWLYGAVGSMLLAMAMLMLILKKHPALNA
ncbi:MAG: VWA domain-containing protein [Oscillospiraceae bacterium]|nr:VWA domain-containing protein [Oscillospiraceae bacterium]